MKCPAGAPGARKAAASEAGIAAAVGLGDALWCDDNGLRQRPVGIRARFLAGGLDADLDALGFAEPVPAAGLGEPRRADSVPSLQFMTIMSRTSSSPSSP